MKNDLHTYIDKHSIPGALLREFISKGLWSAALMSCNELINTKHTEIEKLQTLRTLLIEETTKDVSD
jgi:hypothetical protein